MPLMPLMLPFGRINCCRWLPLHCEDCMNLKTNFPVLNEVFSRGDFVVHHAEGKGGGVSMEQGLDKECNMPAKGPGGVIGITRKKAL